MTVTYGPIGANFERTSTDPEFDLGEGAEGENFSKYVYVRADAGGITGAGYVVLINESFTADMIDLTNSATAFGDRVGVARVAFAANEYGWVQVKGIADIRVAASAAANAQLNTTSTAGQLDDDATAGSEDVTGLVLTTANGGSAGTAPGRLNWPDVGATN